MFNSDIKGELVKQHQQHSIKRSLYGFKGLMDDSLDNCIFLNDSSAELFEKRIIKVSRFLKNIIMIVHFTYLECQIQRGHLRIVTVGSSFYQSLSAMI